jgi:hypothetical protein
VVAWRDHWYFVDAAVSTIEDEVEWSATIRGVVEPACGMRVNKSGAATGVTEGIVSDDHHVERVRFGFLSVDVPNQLRIRPTSRFERFAQDGDSGSVICDDDGRALGLLWGSDDAGEGVACPMGPVLQELNVDFGREDA